MIVMYIRIDSAVVCPFQHLKESKVKNDCLRDAQEQAYRKDKLKPETTIFTIL